MLDCWDGLHLVGSAIEMQQQSVGGVLLWGLIAYSLLCYGMMVAIVWIRWKMQDKDDGNE